MFMLFPDTWILLLMYGINILLTALSLICSWFVYVKMGVPGWKGLVPYYNVWTAIKVLKKPQSWFWIMIGATAVMIAGAMLMMGSFFLAVTSGGTAGPVEVGGFIGPVFLGTLIVFGLCLLVLIVFSVRLTYALCKSFGHGVGYTFGMIFLPFIFFPILAFGPDEFQLPEDRKSKNNSPVTSEAEPGTAPKEEPLAEPPVTEPAEEGAEMLSAENPDEKENV